MAKVTTAWGEATVVEEVTVQQRSGQKRFASVVQLLQNGKGEQLVRFAYTTDGTARRGPVTFRSADVAKLRAALARSSGLAEILGVGADDSAGG